MDLILQFSILLLSKCSYYTYFLLLGRMTHRIKPPERFICKFWNFTSSWHFHIKLNLACVPIFSTIVPLQFEFKWVSTHFKFEFLGHDTMYSCADTNISEEHLQLKNWNCYSYISKLHGPTFLDRAPFPFLLSWVWVITICIN